jgi:hypothetical protein
MAIDAMQLLTRPSLDPHGGGLIRRLKFASLAVSTGESPVWCSAKLTARTVGLAKSCCGGKNTLLFGWVDQYRFGIGLIPACGIVAQFNFN